MAPMLWGTMIAPLAGFLFLILLGKRAGARIAGFVGAGSIAVAAALAVLAAVSYLSAGSVPVDASAGSWIQAGTLDVELSIHYDGLTLVMTLVITVVGFLIHLFSVEYMRGDEAFHRYFAYLNLFVASMLLLVLAGNILVTFAGWEMVGLCSYLLIGFWHRVSANGQAARKAFIVTRIGDAGFAVGIGLLFASLGTLDIRAAGEAAARMWTPGSAIAVAATACLLIGAIGKSAQLPLQVWLPDAMAGPTPVSALIHAATMVTAGVYLVARTHALFELAPVVLQATAWIGVATLLIAGLAAMVQTDLKRTLAYSTISQLGYMFLALGVGGFGAAVFHLFTHAFFKALLFLGAGAVMHATHGETSMLKLGGLRKSLPIVFFTFLAGAASLASLPVVTDGFFSKGWILEEVWGLGPAGRPLWVAAVAGAFVTAFYAFRMVGMVFFGPEGHGGHGEIHRPGPMIHLPLIVLAVGALVAGFIHTPSYLGGVHVFDHLLGQVFGAEEAAGADELLPELYATVASLAGALLALLLYGRGRRAADEREAGAFRRFLASGLGFDALYRFLFIRPYDWLARVQQSDWVNAVYEYLLIRPYRWITSVNRRDVVDLAVRGIVYVNVGMHRVAAALQTGKLRWYLLVLSIGGALIFGLEVLL